MTTFDLGRNTVPVDLDRLIDTRLLVQANSGGGKSWAIRRLLEQTHGQVQHLVIDPEGEFSTLRERYDYVLAAKQQGDTIADPRTAALLAERLLELHASAVLDIYELKAHERVRFVRLFLEALVNAPKQLWHPVLVVVDEAHVYCPQQGDAESADAVKDLATRGRKRGFCAVLATQRLSKLHKDAAAECNNKLIGRTGLDVDVKRVADELGFGKDQHLSLRQLGAGEFFVFGPAISRDVRRMQVGPVNTTHPKAGSRTSFTPPPPTAKVRAMLPSLADLPAEAEERAKSIDDARKEIAELKRKLTIAERAQAPASPPAPPIEIPVLRPDQLTVLERSLDRAQALLNDLGAMRQDLGSVVGSIREAVDSGRIMASRMSRPTLTTSTAFTRSVAPPVQRPVPAGRTSEPAVGSSQRSGVEERILSALAELELLGATTPERELVAFLAGYSHLNSKGFTNGLGALRSAGLIDYPQQGQVALTATGQGLATYPAAPRSSAEIQQRVIALLGGASGRLLKPLIDAYPHAVSRTELAAAAGYGHLNSKGFTNAIGRLHTLGFIRYPERGAVAAAPVLFLEGV